MQQQGHVLRRLCRQGNVELVTQMLDAGVSVDSPQEDGCTGLWLACEHGCTDVVRVLLTRRASPHATKTAGNISALFIAAQNGHAAVVDLLLHHGANPNAVKSSGASPLFIASQQNHPQIVRSLLRAGGNHSTANSNGVTPLMIAAFQGNIECVKLLLAAGADPHAVAQGKNAIEWAAENRHRNEVQQAVDEHLRYMQHEHKRKREMDMQQTPFVARNVGGAAPVAADLSASAADRGHARAADTSFPGTSIAGASPGASQLGGVPLDASAFGGYTPRYLVPNLSGSLSYAGDGGRSGSAGGADGAHGIRVANTRSFAEPLPHGVGNMTPISANGVTAAVIEEEKRRSHAFRSMVRKETLATRPKPEANWQSASGGAAGRRRRSWRSRSS
jgi:hypothetical protein